jgi:hypothetical protein
VPSSETLPLQIIGCLCGSTVAVVKEIRALTVKVTIDPGVIGTNWKLWIERVSDQLDEDKIVGPVATLVPEIPTQSLTSVQGRLAVPTDIIYNLKRISRLQ